jgi:multiple sugar transport system permease protein
VPPHVAAAPLVELLVAMPVPPPLSDNGVAYDQLAAVIGIHVAFQLGFCTLVLTAFMRSIPHDVVEAARLDGASFTQALRWIIVPLSRPALAALAALEAAWIYNDFLWGIVVLQTPGKRPVTSALANLSGEFFTDINVLAAAAVLAALPTVGLFLMLRRHVAHGLTLGATNG